MYTDKNRIQKFLTLNLTSLKDRAIIAVLCFAILFSPDLSDIIDIPGYLVAIISAILFLFVFLPISLKVRKES